MTLTSSQHKRGSILGLNPGDIVDGRLEISSLIGYGGQGVVLKVKHLEWERDLALKLPLPDVVQSPVNRERYLQEAETWIRMGVHPNVVRCWFVHKISGLPGLFLDLVTGGSLEDRMKEGAYKSNDWSLILKALLQVGEGLSHAHTMGVVHRDIKPENILIKEDGTICLTDFGLVKGFDDPKREIDSSEEAVSKDSSVTGTGQFVGTPRYGAPEQWNKKLKIGPATDIYALGVVFFEMLCGRRPFDAPGENPDPLTLIHRHLNDPPPDPRTFRESIPESMADIVLHCLSKDPNHRPQTAEQMIDILAGLLKHLCGEDYHPPAPVPEGEKADLLNNAAVSLYSLGKVEKSRELLRRGLLLQAGHPECLYNLVQLDRREGKITAGESIRIVRRANAKYQLALLCLEEGLGKQAMELLNSIPEGEKNGLIHRIEGDAQMYAKQYMAAQRAYEKAQVTMPYDRPTRDRKILASQGARGHDGHVYFPSSYSAYNNKAPDPELRLMLSWNGDRLVGVTSGEVITLNMETRSVIGQAPRPQEATPPRLCRIARDELLIQDTDGFEFWSVSQAEPIKRAQGWVLATTTDLSRMVLLQREGIFLLDRKSNQLHPLCLPEGAKLSHYMKACFTLDQAGLCLLTTDGRVAQVDAAFRVTELPWPPPIPRYQEICHFQINSSGVLYTVGTSGHFQAIDLGKKKLAFSLKLPFCPDSFAIDATEQHLVVSSPTEYGVMKIDGKVEQRGPGPCAIDPTRQFALLWLKGYLSLFQLTPFRRLRTWAEKIDCPRAINFCSNGSSAVTLAPDGTHHVWEVDEPNRVYERNLLLTPGESYQQLIESYDSYVKLFSQAQRLFQKNRYFHSYSSLRNARSVPGFLQAPEALELQWKVCGKLKRIGMEAIWERLYTTEVRSSSLSEDNENLLLLDDQRLAVRELGEAGGAIRLEFPLPAPLVSCRYLSTDADNPMLLLVRRDGIIEARRADTGEQFLEHDLELTGEVKEAVNQDDSIFVRSESGSLLFFDLSTFAVRSQFNTGDLPILRAFPLQDDRVFLATRKGPAVADLKRASLTPGLPVAIKELPGEPTFAAETKAHGLLLLGFSEGTFYVANRKTGRVLFAANQKKGAVTGACLNLEKGLGVTVSSSGGLMLVNLCNGEIFERFTAHNQPVDSVQMSANARYISTRTVGGQYRLWELSWLLGEEKGNPNIEWLPQSALGKLGKLFKMG